MPLRAFEEDTNEYSYSSDESIELNALGKRPNKNVDTTRTAIRSRAAGSANNQKPKPQFKFRRRTEDEHDNMLGSSQSSLHDQQSTPNRSKSKQTQTKMKRNTRRVNSLSNYLHWRLISSCLKYQLVSQKDLDLVQISVNKAFSKYKSVKLFEVHEFKVLSLLVGAAAIVFALGFATFGEDFMSLDNILDGHHPQSPDSKDCLLSVLVAVVGEEYSQLFQVLLGCLCLVLVASSVLYSLLLLFKVFYYLRLSYLVSTLISSLEHSKLCIKNAIQYLSDYSNVNSGFNFSHKGIANQVKIAAIEANMPLFRSLTGVLIMDILSCQESCCQLPQQSIQLIQVHLCESVDVEKVITTLQDNVQYESSLGRMNNGDVGCGKQFGGQSGVEGSGGEESSSKLETIVQLHYELVTEFYFSLVLSLAHAFFTGNDAMTSEIVTVFKSFIVNYDLSIAQNLEKELDLVQDLFLDMDFEDEDSSSNGGTAGAKKGSRSEASFERSNWKSVLTSFNIHFKEIAKLTNDFKDMRETDERSVEIVKQRLNAALSCVDNLHLLLKSSRKQETAFDDFNQTNEVVMCDEVGMSEDVTTMERQYVANLPYDQFSSSVETTEDDVFLGKTGQQDHNNQSTMGHGDQGSRHVFYNSTFDEEEQQQQQQDQKYMARSQRAMMSELNQVMSQRVSQQKRRENVAIQRKYGPQAVNEMGWDVTAAAFRVTTENNQFDLSTMEASYQLPLTVNHNNLSNSGYKQPNTAPSHLSRPPAGPSGDNVPLLTTIVNGACSTGGPTVSRPYIGARLLQEVVSEENTEGEMTKSELDSNDCTNLENVNSDADLKSDNLSSKIQTFSFNSKTQSQSTFSKGGRRQSRDETTVDDEYDEEEEEEDYGTDFEQKELMKNIMSDNLKLNLNFLNNKKSLSSSGTNNGEEEETFGSSSSLSEEEEGEEDLDNTFSSEEMSPNW